MRRVFWPAAIFGAIVLLAAERAALARRATAEGIGAAQQLAVLGVILLLLAILVGSIWYWRWVQESRVSADTALGRAHRERDALLKALDADRAQLKTIVETVPVGLIMAEYPSGRIIGRNRYLEELLMHPVLHSDDLFGGDENSLVVHRDGTPVAEAEYPLARIFSGEEENPRIELKHRRGDGKSIWMQLVGRPIRDSDGSLRGGVIAVLDISEERAAQQLLEEAVKSKETLLFEVNHRVKNSLQLVTSILAVEASKIEHPEAREAVLSARRKVGLIAQLHQRLFAGGRHSTVDFEAYLQDVMAGLLSTSGRGDDTQIRVVWEGDSALAAAQAAPLGLAVNELVINSLKYGIGDGGGGIEIRGSRDEGELQLVVSDDGPGLPPEAESVADKSLGMHLVRSLVRQMGGEVEWTRPARGVSCVIRVPV